MAVLKKSSFPENLESFNVLVNDTLETSRYFTITDLPDTFTGGKNAFLIQGSEELVPDTIVKIEIKDAKGNVIYTEPGEGIPEYYEGVSKPVAVYVYPDTAYGQCTITILAELDRYDDNGIIRPVPSEWKDKYNVRWQKSVLVNPNLPNTTKIRFYRRPKVNITESILPIFNRTVIRETISGSLYGITVQPSANSNLRSFKGDTIYELYATSSVFSASMEGEIISVYGLNQSYSSEIRDVVNDKKLIVSVPYYETSSNSPTAPQIVKNFVDGNFELTYNKTINLSSSSLNTSFAKIKLTDLEAFTGDPARLKIFAKRKADIGNFTLLEDIQLESKELLNTDLYSSSVDVSTGIFSSQNIIDDFWIYSNYNRDTFYTKTFDNNSLASSVKLLDDGTQNTISTPQRLFYYSQSIDFTKDTEYQLDFLPLLSSSVYTPNKLEVYLSGSSFFNTQNNVLLGKKILELSHDGTIRKYSLQQVNFKPESDGVGKLIFAVYQGNWQISNVGLKASQESSFSPNEITLNVSLPTVVNNDEYEFKFEFYDINNNYVPVVVTKNYTFTGGSNLSNVNFDISASLFSVRPNSNIFPFGYNNNYDFQEVNSFASVPVGSERISFFVTRTGLTGDVTFTSAAFDSGGVYIPPSLYSAIPAPYPGGLNNITTDEPYLTVENFTGSLGNIEVKRIDYTASLGGFEDRISIFKVVEGTPGSDGVNGTQYVITPVSGTAIKNSDPNTYLELQLQKIDASTLSNVTSGNIKLVTGSLNTPISVGNGITAGTNGVLYNPRIYAQKIDGILTVGAYDFDQNILVDTITLADITDGLTTGFIEASDGLIIRRNPSTNLYTPTTTALTASFYDSKGRIYSESILITPNYSSPNDQLKYQIGINDSNINLDYVKTIGGVNMTNNVYTNTQGLTAKFTFTEPNTGQQISINEGVVVALDGTNAEQYVIRPISGTAIKNSDPNSYLEVQITKINGTTLTDLNSGNIKLVTGSLNTVVNVGNGVTAGTNGVNYNARFYASKINGSLTVGAYDTSTSTMLDTITLADITDGLSTGYIESTNGLILGRNPNNTYTPSNTALTASFLGSNSTLYSASVLITPSFSSPNDQLTYTAGYSSPTINLESVKTDTGTTMTNTVASTTKSATVKYKFTDPNTSDVIYVSETVAVALNGTDGSNPVVADYASTQTIIRDKDGNNASVVPFTIQLTETGSLLFYTSSAAKLQRGYFTLELAGATFGTDNSVNQTKSGSITPPQPASTLSTSASFSYKYIDSKGNTSQYISGSHIVSVVKDGPIGPSGGGGEPTPTIIINPVTQITTRSATNVFSVPKPYLISVDETGSLYRYTATNPPPGNSYFTVLINSQNGTLTYTANATSASIQPPTPSSIDGLSSSFAVVYRNSKGTLSQAISQSHNIGVSLDGINGPGVVFTGVWENGRAYQMDSGSTGRRDVVLWSRTGTAPYNSYYGALRSHTSDGTTGATGNGAPNYSTGSASSAWLELGQQSFFVAAKIGLFEESYVQNTLNVGTNLNGSMSAANITLYGGNAYPYISIGQSDSAGTQGYGYNGIFLGAVNDGASGRRYKFSIVTGSSYLKWNGYGQLQISGAISASEGRIGGVTISGSTIYAGAGVYNNSNTGFYLNSSSTNVFSLGDKLSWDGSTLSVNGNINVTGGNAATNTNLSSSLSNSVQSGSNAAANAVTSGSNAAANAALSASLSGSVNPSSQQITKPTTPSAEGLYIGSDYLGYYKSPNWRTYMSSSGNFYLTSSIVNGGYLEWNANTATLLIAGAINIKPGGNAATTTDTANAVTSGSNAASNAVTSGSNAAANAVTSGSNAAANAALSASLSGSVDPASQRITKNTTPIGTGLYLGADNLGYYKSGVWQTYMSSSGNFYLTSSISNGGYLEWNANTATLLIAGAINIKPGGNAATTTDTANAVTSGSNAASNAVTSGSNAASNAVTSGSNAAANAALSASLSGSIDPLTQRLTKVATPSGQGLYLSSEKLGFYKSPSWQTFMSSSGDFYLTGSVGNYLVWDNAQGKLIISGTVSASAGAIGGVRITNDKLFIGVGEYASSSTAFFVSSSGDFSLKDSVVWNQSTSRLTINNGQIVLYDTGSDTRTTITPGGKLVSTGGDVTGKITATSGEIGGWTIQGDSLEASADSPGTGRIKINANRPSIEIYSGSSILVDMSGDTQLSGTGSATVTVSGSAGQQRISSGSRVINTGNIASTFGENTTATFTTGSSIMTGSWSASFVVPQSANNSLVTLNFSSIAASGSASASFNALSTTGYYVSDASFTMRYGFALYSASADWLPPLTYIDKVTRSLTGTTVIGGSRNRAVSGSVNYSSAQSLTLSRNLSAASYSVFPFVEVVSITATATEETAGCSCPSYGTFKEYGGCVGGQQELIYYDGTCTGTTCNTYTILSGPCI